MLKYFLICLLIKQFYSSDPDDYISTFDLIRSKGYPVEEHSVTTQDGYILTMHRISRPTSKRVVFLQHGLLDSSSTWVINYPNQSLGFILYDNDYDVWLGNMRGNRYSDKHVKFNTSDEEYWNFSFDEMSKYDLTSMIDYVVNATSVEQVYYIGHSQGTLIKFINSDYLKKIKLFIALGPVATVAHMNATLPNRLASLGSISNQHMWFGVFGRKDFATTKYEFVLPKICGEDMTRCHLSGNFNKSRLSVYFSHFPSGTSTRNMVHFAQMIQSKNVKMFDYGKLKNLLYYNQTEAPLYDLRAMTTPTALYYGELDRLADPVDVQFIRSSLPQIVDDFYIPNWQHADFVWALNAKDILYDRVLELMKKYE